MSASFWRASIESDHRRRIGDHEALEHADGLGRVARLRVEVRGLQVGLALNVLRLGRVHRDALEFHRGLAGLAGLAVGHRELARDVGVEFALRVVGAEALEHLDGARPFLELTMSCAPASYSACAAIFEVPATCEMRRKSSTAPRLRRRPSAWLHPGGTRPRRCAR